MKYKPKPIHEYHLINEGEKLPFAICFADNITFAMGMLKLLTPKERLNNHYQVRKIERENNSAGSSIKKEIPYSKNSAEFYK